MGYYEDIRNTSGLVGYWRFGEGNTNSGVVAEVGPAGVFPTTRPDLNSAGALVGDTNTAFRFSASNSDYIYWPGSNFTFAGTPSFSLEIWYNPTSLAASSGFQNLISKDHYASGSGYGLYLANASKRVYFTRVSYYEGPKNTTGPIVSVGNWYHLVCTYDGSTQRIYVNGSLFASTADTATITSNTSVPLTLGKSCESNVDYLSAFLDEFSIYNRALSAAEVLQHYNSGTAPILPEQGSASLVTRFTLGVTPSRNRNSATSYTMQFQSSFFGKRDVSASHTFSTELDLDAEGNVSAFPTHFLSASSALNVAPVRQRPTALSLSSKSTLYVRMPMTFLETHTFPVKFALAPKSKVTYKSNKPRLSITTKLNFSGMTRVELDQLFQISASRRSGAIHFAIERMSTEDLTSEHEHMNTMEPETRTPFIARNQEGMPRIVGIATVEWYISRVVVDATTRIYDRPDLLEHFGVVTEVTG